MFVISEPSAASTVVLPAGVRSVSSTGRASSSDAEFLAISPVPPTQGNRNPAMSAPARTIVAASLARVWDRDCTFSDIGDERTWPGGRNAVVSDGALAAPGYVGYRSACHRPGPSVPRP